jgi:adenylate cyclase
LGGDPVVEERAKRKLTAILSADVKGYSRLMGEDELSTVETLKRYREIISSLVKQYSGRVVDSPGDNILAEFSSVVDAVECAVKIQGDLEEKNTSLPENRRMKFRIGVNLGDVIDDEGRIYGDGVNVAARVEGLAEVGGICISRKAFDEVKNKLSLGYEYLGEHSVKNITEPVRVYKVLMEPEHAGKVIGEKASKPKQWRWAALAVGLIIVVGAVAIWNFYFRAPPIEPASVEKMSFPLPEKPSIAILPFENMSGDPEQDYFSDGLTDQIISTLSMLRGLFVISRSSTFTYKGKPVKTQKVSEDLGVKYVLEGSVQRTADRIRITAQLIDATTGHHIWSERYDREPKEIFAIHDDITMEITKAIGIEIIEGEQARIWQKTQTSNLRAYEKYLKGRQYIMKHTKEYIARARPLYEEAVALDPGYARAYVGLGWTYFDDARFGWVKDRRKSIEMAEKYAQKAIELNDTLDAAHILLGAIYLVKRQHKNSIAQAEHALALNPNSAQNNSLMGGFLGCAGRWEEGIGYAEKSIRLAPIPPVWYFWILGRAYFMTGKYDKAIETFKRAIHVNPDYLTAHAFLAACYSSLDRQAEAAAEADEVLRINPQFTLEAYAKTLPYKNKLDIDLYIGALRKAGLPETPPLQLPDKPSIAVLPFVNMSGDPEQEYLSDGITEQIITSISKIPRLFVIARTSSFKYKGKEVDVKQVGRELGVKYILEGSAQRSVDRLRITAQLIDAITGKHLWAERYDRDFKDIFTIQDEITMKIIHSLSLKLTEGDRVRMQSGGTGNLKAVEKVFEAVHYLRAFNRESNVIARQLYEETIALDPEFAGAYSGLAVTHFMDVTLGSTKSPRESLAKATKLLHKAIALDENFELPHSHLCAIYGMQRQYEKAIAEGEKAVALNPNSDRALEWLGLAKCWMGRPEEAIALYEKAMRLCPFPPSYYYLNLGHAYRSMERYKEAITEYKKALHLTPNNVIAFAGLSISYSSLGQEEEARAAAAELLKINPNFSFNGYVKRLPYKNQALKERWCDALQKAGLR